MYVSLDRLDSATTASFLYNLKFKNRVTPEGYTVTPQVDLYVPAGTSALTDDIHIATSDGDSSMQPTVTIKTNQPILNKHIISNASNTTFATDNRIVYAGTENAEGTGIGNAADVAFQYTLSTTQGYQTVNGDYQGWGDGKNRTRAQAQIIVTDTLPTYTKADGSTATALFDATKNLGWTDNGDGTVSYTVNESAAGRGDADTQLMNTVKLLLQFPDAKISPLTQGANSYKATDTITNTAKAELHPVNESDYEKENVVSPVDSINFKLDINPAKLTDGIGLQFGKNSNLAGRISVDPGSMDQYEATFSLSVTNINPQPMTKIVIKDGPFDSRHYLKRLHGGSSLIAQNIEAVYGVKEDGTKVLIENIVNERKTSFNNSTIIDRPVYDQIAGYVEQVNAGTMNDTDVPAVPATYTSLEIQFKPDFALQPGESFSFLVGLGYTDPYHLNVTGNTAADTLRNEASLTGDLGGAAFNGISASSNRLLAMEESFGVHKSTLNNNTGTPGEQLRFDISFRNNLARARRFNNAQIIDVLPQGVTFQSTYPTVPSDKITLVDNFMGSGKQAVIIDLGNVMAADMPSKGLSIYGTINDQATPSNFPGAQEQNTNHVYLRADNWSTIPVGVQVTTTLPDIHNLYDEGIAHPILGAKSSFTALMPTDVTGVKYVRAGKEGEWSLQPVYVNYDSEYQYKLTIRNNEGQELTETTIYDVLPFEGDTYYNYDGEDYPSRDSAFSGIMTGPVIAPEGFTVMYRTDSYMPPNPDAGINDSQAWKTEAQITDWSRVKGFKISSNEGTTIAPYSTTDFIVNMKTQSYTQDNNFNNQTSNNNFAIRYNNRAFGQSNVVSVHLSQTIPVEKVWNGGMEPRQEVYVQLVRDGVDMSEQTLLLNDSNNWEDSFENLPVLSPYGKQYEYTVREVNTPVNYEASISGNQTNGFTITNTFVSPEFKISGTKLWEGGPSKENFQVALQIYRWIGDGDYTNGPNGEADPTDEFNDEGLIEKEAVGNVHYVSEANGWTSSKDNPRYNQQGQEYNYVVREVKNPNIVWDNSAYYEQSVNQTADENGNLYYGEKEYDSEGNLIGWSFDITNTYNSPIDEIIASKVWVGGDYSYPRILIDLYRYKEGQSPEDAELVVDGVSSATSNTSPYHRYKDLPLTDETDGVPYVYRIEEVDLTKMTPEEREARNISQEDVDQFENYLSLRNFANDPLGVDDPNLSIINEYIAPRLVVEGSKTWEGGDAGNRPDATLQLMQNGEKYTPKPTLSGTGVPGSMISVNIGTQTPYTTKVHPDGNWYLEFSKPIAEGTVFSITQTESGKYASDIIVWDSGNQSIEPSTEETPSAAPEAIRFETPSNPIAISGGEKAVWNVPRTDFFEQEYNYQVIEVDVPENYTDSYKEPVEERDDRGRLVKLSQEVVNTYTSNTVEVTAYKEWNGGPETKPGFEFQLYRTTGGDETTKTAVGAPEALLTQNSYTWNVPEKDADGNSYEYFVEESTVPENYTAAYKTVDGNEDRLTIVNTFTPELIQVPVQKVWMGGNLEDRPESITAGLYVGEELAKDTQGNDLTLTLNAEGQWRGEFVNVPAIDAQLNPVEYTVKEMIPEGFKFTPSYEGDQNTGFRITNTFNPDVSDVTGIKEWVGGEEVVGGVTRPPVQLQLLRNLVPIGDPVWVDGNADDNEQTPWHYTWKDLPVQDMTGTDYIYTIEEVNIPEHFTAEYEGLKVTNTYSPAQVDFTARKEWVNGPENHPTAVFQLYRALASAPEEKEKVDDLIYVRGDIHTWENLPAANEAGEAYSYWVEEENIPENYTSTRSEVVGNTQTITNTYNAPTGNITGYKVWEGGPAEKPDVTLILERQIGTGEKEIVAEQVLANGDTDALWENVELEDHNGNAYIFSVREKEIPENYTVSYNGMTATNTYAIPKDGVVEAVKIWEGGPSENRPDVYFELYRQTAGGEAERVPGTDNKQVETPDGAVTAKVSWENLETKDSNGNNYIFTVREVGTPRDYTKTENGLTVTNTYNIGTTKFRATKNWVGGPEEKPVIGLQLKQRLETQPEEEAILYGPAAALTDALSYEWTDLPKTDSRGIPYVYSVDETSVPRGYQKTLGEVSYNLWGEGRQTITNTMETRDLSFTKTWVNGPDTKPEAAVGVRVNGEQITDISGRVVSDVILRNGTTQGVFRNLPYYDSNGNEISYNLVETRVGNENVVEGKAGNYQVSISGTNITNTYIPDKTEIYTEKVWEGGSTESHEPIKVQLFREAAGQNKEFVGDAVVLEETNSWKHRWTDLDASNEKGAAYTYSVEETNTPVSYTADVSGTGSAEDPFVITNTYDSERTDITAFKKWIGGPAEKPDVELVLYRQTEGMENPERVPQGLPIIGLQNPISLQNGEISYTWENLPLNDTEGNPYSYSVAETKIGTDEVVENQAQGYSVSYDGMVVTNSYTAEETKITAEKIWSGGPAEDHTAPEFVLTQNGRAFTERDPVITPEEGTAERFLYEWTVPKTDEFGQEYQYSVDEAAVPEGYGKSIRADENGKWIITNTFEAKRTDISVHKDWVGGSGYPDITFELQRRAGTEEFETVAEEVLPSGDHIHIWRNQPLTNEKNEAYEYRVRETFIGTAAVENDAALNYKVSYSGSVMEGFTVTNTSDNVTEIPVKKIWKDQENAQNTRPERIAFTAVREDGAEKTQVFDVTDENIYTITGLEKYKPNSTEEYRYTIKEMAVPGYQSQVDNFTVTNTLSGTTKVDFTKVWVGGPETKPEVTIELSAEGNPALDAEGNPVEPIRLANGETTGSFTKLPAFTAEGAPISYTVRETAIDGETVENGKAGNYTVAQEGTTITNTFIMDTVSFTAKKVWEGGPETKPTVGLQLYQRLSTEDENAKKPYGQLIALNNGSSSYTWENLPKTDSNGASFIYSVDEPNVPAGFEKTIGNVDPETNSQTITNTFKQGEIEVEAVKIWSGGNPADHVEADITLYQNGSPLEKEPSVEKLEGTETEYKYTWTVPAQDNDGTSFIYTVEEETVPENYVKTQEGNRITNTFTVSNIEITVSKTWIGGLFNRENVELQLYRKVEGGELEKVEGMKLLTNGDASVTWNVPKTNQQGQEYQYSVNETNVPADFTAAYTEGGLKVTNTYKSPAKDITAVKEWVGGPAEKPEVKLQLLRNGEKLGDLATLDPETNSYTWENMDINDQNGAAYKYTVVEEPIEQYESNVVETAEGFKITNTFTSEKGSVTGIKAWKGGPEEKPAVDLVLLQNGETYTGEGVLNPRTVSASSNWQTTWTDLPLFDNEGKEYLYTVDEVNTPADYEKSYESDGRTVTNTYLQSFADIKAEKVWNGGPLEKPEIKLQLIRDGEALGDPVVLKGTSHIWEQQPLTDENGKAYEYTVAEADVPEGYELNVSGNIQSGFILTNTYKDTTQVEIQKVWKDQGESTRPDMLIFMAVRNDGEIVRKVFDRNTSDVYIIDGLEKYDEKGEAYSYTVDEGTVPGYEKSIDGNTITNTLTGKTTITVRKVWEGVENPSDYTAEFQLYADNEAVEGRKIEISGDGVKEFADLNTFDENGNTIEYTVREINVPEGFETAVVEKGNCGCDYVFTNKKLEEIKTADVAFTKIDGLTEETLSDAAFDLRNIEGEQTFKAVSNEEGVVEFKDVPEGNYLLTETTAPEGYLLNNVSYTVNVAKDGAVRINGEDQVNYKISNLPETPEQYTVVLQKTDDKNQVLGNAEFGLYDSEDKKLSSHTTNDQGLILVEGLEAGEYYFQETKAPEGYRIVGEGKYRFQVPETEGSAKTAVIYAKNSPIEMEKIELAAEKVWVGEDESRPDITLRLMDGNEQVDFAVLKSGETTHIFKDLEKYRADGTEISYTLKEDPVEGYTSKIEGMKATNTKIEDPAEEPETVNVKGEKVWIGGDGTRPTIQLQLFQNGEKYGEPISLENGTTEYIWENLPKADENGKDYVYTVDEVAVPEGYEKVPYKGTVVINKVVADTPEPEETTSVTGTKVWIGGPDEKPAIQLQLKRNGENYLEPKELMNGNTEAVWSDLPLKDEKGELYEYTVDEVSVPEGYEKVSYKGRVVINKAIAETPETSETTNVTGIKIWDGGPDTKPDIELQLYRNGVKQGEPANLKNGTTQYTWENLPKEDEQGVPYKYTVDEAAVPEGYEKVLHGDTVVINKFKDAETPPAEERIKITGRKVWVGGPKEKPEIKLQLLQNGKNYGAPVTLKSGTTDYVWENVPKKDGNGKDYVYTVDESAVPQGYEKVLSNTTVINIYKTTPTNPTNPTDPANPTNPTDPGETKDTVDITGEKIWKGGPEKKPAIKLQLMQNGKVHGDPVELKDMTEYTWKDLPKADASGKNYIYTVDEVEVPADYKKSLSGTTVTNTHKDYEDPAEKIDLVGKKIWKGGPDKKPAIKLQLMQNGKAYGDPVELKDETEYLWKDLPKKDSEGKDYIYTVDEVDVPEDYKKSVSGMTVTNTHKDYVEPSNSGGSNNTGGSNGSRGYQNITTRPVSSSGSNNPSYTPAEIPKTSDPAVFWGMISGSLMILLGGAVIGLRKLKEEK